MSKKYTLPFLISSIVFLISFVLFYYTDLKSLTIWTTNVWDTLAETGNIRHFYEYSAMNLYRLDHTMVGNDILIYLPWAVWNLPIWALQHFGGLNILEHFWMVLYSKLFLLVVFFGVLYLTRKIALLITPDLEEIRYTLFLGATSFFTLSSLTYAGQNDVLVILPFLLALYKLMQGHKKSFLCFSALSIALKPFFAFSFIALILLKEKNLLKELACGCAGCIFLLLQKLLFHGAPKYYESMHYGPMKDAFGLLLDSSLNLPPAGVSLFVLGLCVIWLLAYLYIPQKDPKAAAFPESDSVKSDSAKSDSAEIYFATAPLIVFFLFTRYESYRPFYLVPLLYLLMLQRPSYKRFHLLLEMVSTGALMAFYLIEDVLFYNPNYMLNLRDILHRGQTMQAPAISEFLGGMLPGFGFKAFTAVFALSMSLFLILNYPGFHSKNEMLCKKEEPWLLTLRSVLFSVPPVFSLILRIKY